MSGRVAIRYVQTVPHTLRVRGEMYAFVVRANINLCWVKEEHVDTVLATKRRGCCGNRSRRQGYSLADEIHIRRWTVGGGR